MGCFNSIWPPFPGESRGGARLNGFDSCLPWWLRPRNVFDGVERDEVVSRIFASRNQLNGWLRSLGNLRRAMRR
jgi:hypothetical protein